jgi:hypothetical protein
MTLSPPDPAQAAEFNITYDTSYWGTENKIYGTFGKGNLRGMSSEDRPYPSKELFVLLTFTQSRGSL